MFWCWFEYRPNLLWSAQVWAEALSAPNTWFCSFITRVQRDQRWCAVTFGGSSQTRTLVTAELSYHADICTGTPAHSSTVFHLNVSCAEATHQLFDVCRPKCNRGVCQCFPECSWREWVVQRVAASTCAPETSAPISTIHSNKPGGGGGGWVTMMSFFEPGIENKQVESLPTGKSWHRPTPTWKPSSSHICAFVCTYVCVCVCWFTWIN